MQRLRRQARSRVQLLGTVIFLVIFVPVVGAGFHLGTPGDTQRVPVGNPTITPRPAGVTWNVSVGATWTYSTTYQGETRYLRVNVTAVGNLSVQARYESNDPNLRGIAETADAPVLPVEVINTYITSGYPTETRTYAGRSVVAIVVAVETGDLSASFVIDRETGIYLEYNITSGGSNLQMELYSWTGALPDTGPPPGTGTTTPPGGDTPPAETFVPASAQVQDYAHDYPLVFTRESNTWADSQWQFFRVQVPERASLQLYLNISGPLDIDMRLYSNSLDDVTPWDITREGMKTNLVYRGNSQFRNTPTIPRSNETIWYSNTQVVDNETVYILVYVHTGSGISNATLQSNIPLVEVSPAVGGFEGFFRGNFYIFLGITIAVFVVVIALTKRKTKKIRRKMAEIAKEEITMTKK